MEEYPAGVWVITRPDIATWTMGLRTIPRSRALVRALDYIFLLSRRIDPLLAPPAEDEEGGDDYAEKDEEEDETQVVEPDDDEEAEAALQTLTIKGTVCWTNASSVRVPLPMPLTPAANQISFYSVNAAWNVATFVCAKSVRRRTPDAFIVLLSSRGVHMSAPENQ
jgi:hypothetical protein